MRSNPGTKQRRRLRTALAISCAAFNLCACSGDESPPSGYDAAASDSPNAGPTSDSAATDSLGPGDAIADGGSIDATLDGPGEDSSFGGTTEGPADGAAPSTSCVSIAIGPAGAS